MIEVVAGSDAAELDDVKPRLLELGLRLRPRRINHLERILHGRDLEVRPRRSGGASPLFTGDDADNEAVCDAYQQIIVVDLDPLLTV